MNVRQSITEGGEACKSSNKGNTQQSSNKGNAHFKMPNCTSQFQESVTARYVNSEYCHLTHKIQNHYVRHTRPVARIRVLIPLQMTQMAVN